MIAQAPEDPESQTALLVRCDGGPSAMPKPRQDWSVRVCVPCGWDTNAGTES